MELPENIEKISGGVKDRKERDINPSNGKTGSNEDDVTNGSGIGAYSKQMPSKQSYSYRTSLPAVMKDNHIGLWGILKQCIGKELSKIAMPVNFNEPLSFLQRFSEYLEYIHLLDRANSCNDPLIRMQHVTTFAICACSSNAERLTKPFNPLLGETFELERPDLGYRFISEQVSHHPPISAFYTESKNYLFYGSVQPKLKFWGKSVEIQPKGDLTVKLLRHNEVYTWNNVNSCVHNIIMGKLWIEQYGQMEVISHTSGLKAVINFKPGGWFKKELNRVEGCIYNQKKVKQCNIYGKWIEALYVTNVLEPTNLLRETGKDDKRKRKEKKNHSGEPGSPNESPNFLTDMFSSFHHLTTDHKVDEENETTDTASLLWEVNPKPPDSLQYYNFTYFALMLNELLGEMENNLAPTDSRLRPDIRLLEKGCIADAASEKERLEEKQRISRKLRGKNKEQWSPLWFTLINNPYTNSQDWQYKGGFWEKNYSNYPDIY